ncbi:hypothetical protein CspeluHIS016_0503390 [Cutaneotrichosporon spelunceum]|uniref:Ubiquitin 3 binding protein But2 C-terminal domain-containing protein n=1 Tax=Cutaneotrichosporon spelunceum TaxID=1672016 RepID=A0AAD3TWS8_9TREE|nr:hypothetical protein CspeluHIS016_0503390 [Cutaneotrichosporon spelunceum]
MLLPFLFLALLVSLTPASARWVSDLCPGAPGALTPPLPLPPGMAEPDGPLNFVLVARGKATQCGTQTWARAKTYDAGCVLTLPPFFGALAPDMSCRALDIAYPQIGAVPQIALEIVELGNQLTATDPGSGLSVTLNVSARIAPPRVNRLYDLDWTSYNAVAGDSGFGTEVLRIYTAGGVPRRCREGRLPDEVDYAALYWFYK